LPPSAARGSAINGGEEEQQQEKEKEREKEEW